MDTGLSLIGAKEKFNFLTGIVYIKIIKKNREMNVKKNYG
jgi:hypothetical protein